MPPRPRQRPLVANWDNLQRVFIRPEDVTVRRALLKYMEQILFGLHDFLRDHVGITQAISLKDLAEGCGDSRIPAEPEGKLAEAQPGLLSPPHPALRQHPGMLCGGRHPGQYHGTLGGPQPLLSVPRRIRRSGGGGLGRGPGGPRGGTPRGAGRHSARAESAQAARLPRQWSGGGLKYAGDPPVALRRGYPRGTADRRPRPAAGRGRRHARKAF
jgi:hypothetical protein